jgi:hypothetical protein
MSRGKRFFRQITGCAKNEGTGDEMSANFTESVVEQAALAWLESLGYQVLSGIEVAPGGTMAERIAGRHP